MLVSGRLVVFAGLAFLLHAAYSAAQHRSYIRLTEQEFDSLPSDIFLQALIAFLLTTIGIIQTTGNFKEIEASADLREKTWDIFGNHSSFYTFNHRASNPLDTFEAVDS